jgi:ribonuclease P protein component
MSALATNGGVGSSDSQTRNSFPRSVRLLRHADFERVYKQGRRHFAAHMTVFYLPRKDKEKESDGGNGDSGSSPGSRVGFTVGKVLGGAVVRNRMKRLLREAVRLHGPIRASVDVVINPKRSMLTTRFEDLQKEVSRAFDVIAKSGEKNRR